MCTSTRYLDTTKHEFCPKHKDLDPSPVAHRKCPDYKYIEMRTQAECEAEAAYQKSISGQCPHPEVFRLYGHAEDSEEMIYAKVYHKECLDKGGFGEFILRYIQWMIDELS